jgi:hypothetical protein
MKKIFLGLTSLVILGSSIAAYALDLQSARSQGLVAEKTDGFVKAVTDRLDVNTLVNEVNALRQNEYKRISGENGQPVSVVAKVASEQIVSKLPAGSLYENSAGAVIKK